MNIPCYVCGASSFSEVLDNNPSMSSDGQIVDLTISKQECSNCGTVRSSDISFLNDFYKNYYKLNVVNNDPVYIFQGEKMLKSEMHLEWITKLVGNRIEDCKSIIEIGCGSGNLLNLFEIKDKYGVEPSEKAAKYASAIAKIRNIGYEEISEKEKYDFIFSSCVIEHTIDPNDFLQKNWHIANDNSIIVIGLPIQDTESFDVYFLDHLHHFTVNQFVYLCQKNGFTVENYEVGYKCMTTMGYFVLRKNATTLSEIKYEKNHNFYASNVWIENLNTFLKQNTSENLVAFGYGETSFFYQSYTQLNSVVNCFIDDVKAKSEENVISVEEAINKNIVKDSFLILLANPHYHEFLKEKFKTVSGLKFYSPFSNKIS
ncbi:class I SAM-dependent methyltransferase [Flavobacterium amnicola]|nr:methyltransferase domain-containing protein [Flavobacterium amnicola]